MDTDKLEEYGVYFLAFKSTTCWLHVKIELRRDVNIWTILKHNHKVKGQKDKAWKFSIRIKTD